jgi:hypothetical protein
MCVFYFQMPRGVVPVKQIHLIFMIPHWALGTEH